MELHSKERRFGMNYISVKEASEKWRVTERQIQRLLAADRIPHAKKYGRAWMIPADAEKPADPRRIKESFYSLTDELSYIAASTTVPMPGDAPDRILDMIGDERLRIQYEGELAYLRGDFERVMCCFRKTEGDDASKLRACPIAIVAAVSTGDYNTYTEIDAYLKKIVKADISEKVSAFAEISLATVAVSVIAPNMVPDWLKNGDFGALFPCAIPDALYLRAKYFHSVNNLEAMLALCQTALSLAPAQNGITVPDIYLRVTCAVACHVLGRKDEAEKRLLDAMKIALPHGFITPFAEVVTAFGGLVESCLERSFPNYYEVVIGQWKRTWKNWISFHNRFTKDNITLILSLREYHIAVLVARRVPYVKIAEQYGISVGRLKNIVLEIYQKLCISGRDELSQYIF